MATKQTSIKTVGILTSGGDAPGLNAAIRALCISGKNNYGMKFIGIRNGYRGLIDGDVFKMDTLDLEPLISAGGTILGTSRVKPFKNPQPDPKTGLLPVEGIKKTFKDNKLDSLSKFRFPFPCESKRKPQTMQINQMDLVVEAVPVPRTMTTRTRIEIRKTIIYHVNVKDKLWQKTNSLH